VARIEHEVVLAVLSAMGEIINATVDCCEDRFYYDAEQIAERCKSIAAAVTEKGLKKYQRGG